MKGTDELKSHAKHLFEHGREGWHAWTTCRLVPKHERHILFCDILRNG